MSIVEFLSTIIEFAKNYATISIGLIIAAIGLILLISEVITKIKHGTATENIVLSLIGLTFGLVLVLLQDWLMGIAIVMFVLAAYETYELRESPVWRELMITSLITYFIFLVGTILAKVFNEERFTGWAYNLMFYVFIILAIIFFGKKFVLVSRLMSPQILYLTLFALVYVVLYSASSLFEEFTNLAWNYLSLPEGSIIRERVIFATIGTYEVLILLSFFIYFISGWLLNALLGIKPVEDDRILNIVDEVRNQLGIKTKVKVGYVKAPILNAMAFGPFFDQRVAFICNDLNDFTDADIRGIVGHELAHNSRGHIIWLQIIASLEMIIKKALLLPATTLDYAAYKDLSVSFLSYFLINYGIIAFLFIFVRILEGDADLQTKKAGYGDSLAQALYKLEGFYQGIAGDFGLNVQLLTGKEFSEQEKMRFQGEAAISLYKQLYKPNRWAMFSNVFMSHPRTTFRILSMIDEDLSPVKSALLPYWLILPDFIRNKQIQKLTQKRDKFCEMISDRYTENYGETGIKKFLELVKIDELYEEYIGKNVIAYDKTFETVYEGRVEGLEIGNIICKPLLLVLDNNGKIDKLPLNDYSLNIFELGEKYILKNGQVGKLIGWEKSEKNKAPIFTFQHTDKEDTFKEYYTGKQLNYFKNLEGKDVFFHDDGIDKAVRINKIELGKDLQNTTFTIQNFTLNDSMQKNETFKLSQLITELSPVFLRINKKKKEQQNSLLELLKNRSVIIYTKEELEVGLNCQLLNYSDKHIMYLKDKEEQQVNREKVDYIEVYADIPKFILKKHLSFMDKFAIYWSNRKEMKYINP